MDNEDSNQEFWNAARLEMFQNMLELDPELAAQVKARLEDHHAWFNRGYEAFAAEEPMPEDLGKERSLAWQSGWTKGRDNYELAQKLVAEGYYSTSNRYLTVGRVPDGKTAVEVLRELDPKEAVRLEKRFEDQVRSNLLRYYHVGQVQLTARQFRAFKRAGGESA